MNDEQLEAGYAKLAADPEYQAASDQRRRLRQVGAATQSLAGHTIWNVAEWIEAQAADTGANPYEIFPSPPRQQELNADEKFGYRIAVQRVPLRGSFRPQSGHEKIEKAIAALDDHFIGVNPRARRELHAFLAAYDIPWNNPA